MDIQSISNDINKAVTYMCQYFSNPEAFENNMYHHDTMKKIVKA